MHSTVRISLVAIVLVVFVLVGFTIALPQAHAALTCSPAETTVATGQNVVFTASGVATTSFDWGSSHSSAANAGATFSVTFTTPGDDVVIVHTNDGQTGLCLVHVVGTGGTAPGAPATGSGGTLVPIAVPLVLIALLGTGILYAFHRKPIALKD